MSDLLVTSISMEELLDKLRSREWLIPQFQREFIWSIANVIDFAHSVLFARPIGMATLWEQEEDSQLPLAPISLPGIDSDDGVTKDKTFCDTEKDPTKKFAVLDGRQRCTAVAMLFGRFHSDDPKNKLSGRYFLDVSQKEPSKQIIYFKEKEITQKGYDTDAACTSDGLFPLSSNTAKEKMLPQWMRYVQTIRNRDFYPDGKLPAKDELDRRERILKQAFEGIIRTRLAVYIVPSAYSLAEVCEIFETLNVTGTKVSTVDLVHSWLYADTAKEARQILLRDWIDEFGQSDGAIGWADSDDRPELVLQMVTASHIALESKPKPRATRGKKDSEMISSVKAEDLLRTPTQHWKNMIANETVIAEALGDFQKVVADGYFAWTDCPYPVSASIYVALRLHSYFDPPETHRWGREDLNAIFRAFFWRNALTNRYDQGFLTQLGEDIKTVKAWLRMRADYQSSSQWATEVTKLLDSYMKKTLPTKDDLMAAVTDTVPIGALGKALMLPMHGGARRDLVDGNRSLEYPTPKGVPIHHIYPKNWCQNNKMGRLAILLDKKKAGKDWVNSAANLMPLSRESNNLWKAKPPGQVLAENGIVYEHVQDILRASFMDRQCFDYLLQGEKNIQEFWERRATLIVEDLLRRMTVIT
ncbi:MAG: DUF262 domain-containing protein [Dehalococcoidia bacterium]